MTDAELNELDTVLDSKSNDGGTYEFPEELKEKMELLTEDKFWDLVSYADWPNRDYRDVSGEYLRLLSFEEAVEFRKIESALWVMLDKFIGSDRNPAGGGDDSHGDLIHHIIGLGREQFYAHLNDYELIKARGSAPYNSPDGYLECFAYCIPYDTDYEKKNNVEHFTDFARRVQEELDSMVEEIHPAVLKPISDRLAKLAYIMEFFKNGDFKGGMEQYEQAMGYIKEIDTVMKENKHLGQYRYGGGITMAHNFLLDFPKYVEVENL